jgi:hypothetical protein
MLPKLTVFIVLTLGVSVLAFHLDSVQVWAQIFSVLFSLALVQCKTEEESTSLLIVFVGFGILAIGADNQ